MFDVRNVGSPDENFENLIRASRKSAPSQGEFEMEQFAAEIEADRAAELNRREAQRQRELAEQQRRRRLQPFRGIRLPEERGGTAMGRHISGQAEEAAARREEIRNRPPPAGPLNQPAPTPRPF